MTFLCLRRVWVLLLFFPSAALADEPFLKDRTVVVVAGLPGDMESERNFAEQTARLLTDFARPETTPQQVFLLSSLAKNLDFKAPYAMALLPNDRETFLGLADKLKDSKAPVTFIVFGHGGNQGDTPVFHVPGPRLTPDDFAQVAKACPSSTWCLFFPGSGFFAQALRGPGRTTLATEADDKHFHGDPISFGLFAGLLDKETDLNRLADRLGTVTDRWYQDRSLARTEEPALWVNSDAPRKLINDGLVGPGGTPVATTNVVVNPAPPGTSVPGPEWAGIQHVKPQDYPQADAVVLSRRESYVLGDDTQVTEEEETFIQILTRQGKKYGDFDYTFSPPEEDLSFQACEVRLANGGLLALDPDAIRDGANASMGNYPTGQRKFFSMPSVEPGAIVHVKLKRYWKRFPFPHVFEEIPLVSDAPTKEFKVEFSLPERSAFHSRITNYPPVDPAVAKSQYGSTYTWQFHDLPALADEPLRAANMTPELIITTFPDWAGFASWYTGIIRESDNPTPEMKAQAAQLVASAKTDRERIAAVARYVTAFRYVSVPLGVNSYRPHAAANVWANRYGDCKDKANLLNTMLRTLGYKCNLVLVPRFSQAYEDLPGFAFNHAISQVKLGEETLWIDSTDDVCRFGLLPPGDPGRKVLVIGDSSHALTQLPEAEAKDHRLTLDTQVDMAGDATAGAQVTIRAQTTGYADYLLRASILGMGPRSIVPLLGGTFEPTTGEFDLQHQEATPVAELDQSFSWKGEGSWPGLISRLPESSTRLMRLPAWLPREWSVATLPRTTPLHLNQGYPMEISQRWTVRLPAGASGVKLPAVQLQESKVLSWKLTWTSNSASEVGAKLDLILLKADLTLDEVRRFQTSCHQLEQALQNGLSFQAAEK